MNAFRTGAGAIVRINVHLLTAFGCGFVAWATWPTAPEWWGLGIISIIFGIGAFGEFIRALRLIGSLYNKERVVADYMAQGGKPKSSRLASLDDLKRAGMLDE